MVWWLGDPSTMVEMVAGEIGDPVILAPVALAPVTPVAGESVDM